MIVYFTMFLVVIFALPACGNGNGGTTIGGDVANGTISNGTVTAYGVVNGIKDAVLDTTTTDTQGNYFLNMGSYSGTVLVEVTGGTYLDAATKTTLPLVSPLWSVVGDPASGVSASITPLSDAVVIMAAELPGGLNAANIAAATNKVKGIVGFDPITTLPADPTNTLSATGSNTAKAYGAYIGALFQYFKDNPDKKLLGATDDFAAALNGSSLFGTPAIKKSIANFLASQNNKTGLSNTTDLENLSISLGAASQVIPTTAPVATPNIIPVIQVENAKTSAQGVTTAWQTVSNAWNNEISGYASAVSINRGESIDLHVSTIDPAYTISVYRIGWYGGAGGRLVAGPISLTGIAQPACPMDATTGMTECNWTSSYTLMVPNNTSDPTDWASGYYLAKLTGSSGKQKYIIFVVRDDSHTSDFLFQASVTTYQAYNNWGGKSLYAANSTNNQPAYKVSFNRPYDSAGSGADPFMTYEIEMVRFMEKEGYDVTYSTDIDTYIAGSMLLNHKAFLSVGHDEYWTKEMRDNIEAARDAGVNLGFFGANAGYWQIRLEPGSAPMTQPNRTIAAYRSVSPTLDPVYAIHPELSAMSFRSAQVHRPEAALIGVMYDYSPVNSDMVIKDCSSFICAGTALVTGSTLPYMLGYEVDRLDISSPAGIQVIASSPYNVCLDPPACSSMQTRYSSATYYQAASGAGVFATGSMQWNWGLSVMGYRIADANPAVQQMTRNVLNHFAGK